MSAVMGIRPGRGAPGPGDSGGTGDPGTRRPRGVDEAAGAALDPVVRADRGRADRRPGCRDPGLRDAFPRLGGQSHHGVRAVSAELRDGPWGNPNTTDHALAGGPARSASGCAFGLSALAAWRLRRCDV